jgi:hypothetical protein
MSLETGHQQSSGYSFPYDIANHQPKLVSAKFEKVAEIPANLAPMSPSFHPHSLVSAIRSGAR